MTDESGRSDGATTPEAVEDALERLFRDTRVNAALAWLLVGVLALVLAESVVEGDRQWMAFVAVAGAVVLVPPVAHRDWRVMLPWELLVVALLPVLVRGVLGGTTGTFAAYLSVAALALVVTVELHMFTSLRVTQWFAVALVVIATMASAVAWTIVRWNLDRFLGTSYLSTNDALMVEFVWVTVAGFAAGVLFEAYFRQRDRRLRRALDREVTR